jgi:hypothetical protein
MEALMGKHTFLADPVWRKIPFEKHGKLYLSQLMDILLLSPEMHMRGQAIKSETDPEKKMELCLALVPILFDLEAQLRDFYTRVEADFKGPLYWPVLATSKAEGGSEFSDYPFPVRFEFSHSRVGIMMMLYWGALTILWSGMCNLYQTMALTCPTFLQTMLPDEQWTHIDAIAIHLGLPILVHQKDYITMARNICQSAESCMDEDLSMPIVLGPLCMVGACLDADKPEHAVEIRWIVRCMQILEHRGVGISKYFPVRETLERGVILKLSAFTTIEDPEGGVTEMEPT